MEKTAEKKAPAKKAVVKKVAAPKVEAPKASPKSVVAPKTSDKRLVVVQIRSGAGSKPGMNATLKGLGLGKINACSELEDTLSVRGMIRKVAHLVTVEGE